MVFVYIRIYYAAKARARRGIRKQPRKPPNEQVSHRLKSRDLSAHEAENLLKHQLRWIEEKPRNPFLKTFFIERLYIHTFQQP